jgi:hypothetical protein
LVVVRSQVAATMTRPVSVAHLEAECRPLFTQLAALQTVIRQKLSAYADGKTLKGDELVGWLGEICGKLHLDGTLVDDSAEHDFVTPKGWRVSVKTRRGSRTGWQRSSAVPRIDGDGCPTHLLFVHLNDDYSVERMWLYSWPDLVANNRFKKHVVRGLQRSFVFTVDPNNDKKYVIYGAEE